MENGGCCCCCHQKENAERAIKKAVLILKQKAWVDLRWFNHPRVALSCKALRQLLTEDMIRAPNDWALMPANPNKPIAPDNVEIVTSERRRTQLAAWKRNGSADEYRACE